MQFNYQPEGTETPRTWEYDPHKLMSPEAEAIERLTDMTFGEWQVAVQRDSIRALHALLFVLLRRDDKTLKYDQVQFSMSEVRFTFGVEERTRIRDGLRASKLAGELDENGLQYLAELEADVDLPDPPAAPAPDVDNEGEAEAAEGPKAD